MLIAAFLFQPVRNWMQERLDPLFLSRSVRLPAHTGGVCRELSSETDLDAMLSSVGDRLIETLSIKHLAFFLAEERSDSPEFRLRKAMGSNPRLGKHAPPARWT